MIWRAISAGPYSAGITGPLTATAIGNLTKIRVLNITGIGSFGAFPEALGTPEASLGALKVEAK
jgi:hypothetical protein